jgi:hypothetical protein
LSAKAIPGNPKVSPFPVGVLALRVREWEKEGRPSRTIHACGSRCFVLEGLTWGRSVVWLHEDSSLILVEGNPLEDIRALRKLRLVIRDGAVLDPTQLRSLAGLTGVDRSTQH